jgi:aryl-alcohol dehydrogenase-like predicted oxidoreductase
MALNDYYTLGSSGLRVSSLALGTMTFDDGSWGSRPADSFAILDCYLGLGGNFIDTANFYGGGQSEETLGAYFTANPGKRERVVLATKFCMSLIPDDPNAGGAGRKAIIAQLDRSLSRLKTRKSPRGVDFGSWQYNRRSMTRYLAIALRLSCPTP